MSIGSLQFAGLAGIEASARSILIAGLNALVSGAIQFGGTQLINALIPPPRTPVAKQETTPHSYTVSGTANAAAPFSPIPKLYGQRRIFPQYAASPYNELVGFDQYLRMLFLLGYGPLDISQIKIGDTAIEDYEDVEWELRQLVIRGLDPRIHASAAVRSGWMPGSSPGMTNGARAGLASKRLTKLHAVPAMRRKRSVVIHRRDGRGGSLVSNIYRLTPNRHSRARPANPCRRGGASAMDARVKPGHDG
ncbi:hypothetical protein IMX07_16220 [bacterium]|nr:hypothetical protein [bacterium]